MRGYDESFHRGVRWGRGDERDYGREFRGGPGRHPGRRPAYGSSTWGVDRGWTGEAAFRNRNWNPWDEGESWGPDSTRRGRGYSGRFGWNDEERWTGRPGFDRDRHRDAWGAADFERGGPGWWENEGEHFHGGFGGRGPRRDWGEGTGFEGRFDRPEGTGYGRVHNPRGRGWSGFGGYRGRPHQGGSGYGGTFRRRTWEEDEY